MREGAPIPDWLAGAAEAAEGAVGASLHRAACRLALWALAAGTSMAAHGQIEDAAVERVMSAAASRQTEAERRTQVARLRWESDRRRAAAHAVMPDTMYASTAGAPTQELNCPVPPRQDVERVLQGLTAADDLLGTGLVSPDTLASRDGGLFRSAPLGGALGSPAGTVARSHDGWASAVASNSTSGATTHLVPMFPAASDPTLQGFVRVVNHSAEAGEVSVLAIDDTGTEYGPLTLSIEAGETVPFNSDDLEMGNPAKGLSGSTGSGQGDWYLQLTSDLDIEVLSYVRTVDGFLTSMHDLAPVAAGVHQIAIFNPGSNGRQVSRLRLVNVGDTEAQVTIEGVDDRGLSPGSAVEVTVAAGAAQTLTAAELESGGTGMTGALGDGAGKWRLTVTSAGSIHAMSLLSSPTGHLTNLSTAPALEPDGVHAVSMFPSASDATLEGFVRVRNRGDTQAQVTIQAYDDTDWDYGPLRLTVAAGAVAQFNSDDLEQGNPGKGLTGSTGVGEGDWRLELLSAADIEVLAYIRTTDGFLTAMHDAAPVEQDSYRIAIFNPGGNDRQVSWLRIVNAGDAEASVSITGIDDSGASPGSAVELSVPAGTARAYPAAALESGGEGLAGALGDGVGKWRLEVTADQPIRVLSLLSSSTGHLTNLSTAVARGSGVETAEEVFGTLISPIVQSQCVVCHVEGGLSGNTRLVFVTDADADHVATNFSVFEAFLEEVEDGADYLLNKVQGVGHGGGIQLAAGTEGFSHMERFLGLLEGEEVGPVAITPANLFDGVKMESWSSTLRRAAIIFGGRVPTEDEYASIRGASVPGFRAAIRQLMQGPEFHEFLIRGSNDRLLTDRDEYVIDATASDDFVDFANLYYDKVRDHYESGGPDHWRWYQRAQYGIRRAPLELIAHMVENDLPYTEVLTADYIMANPAASAAYGASTAFRDADDDHEFRPSEIASYYRDGPSKVSEFFTATQLGGSQAMLVKDPGDLATDYPHAGILNTTVFLLRYPTTATNRNRARSRWTYYHFLGLDVEKSAGRTTDPVALADTNNPTMNNPACTVCHTVMDPVAGAFQNYGPEGFYRDQWGGLDSLDGLYKADRGIDLVIGANAWSDRETLVWTIPLAPGVNVVNVDFTNDFYDEETGDDGFVYLDRLRVVNAAGATVAEVEFEDLDVPIAPWGPCGDVRDDPEGPGGHVALWNGGPECTTWVDVDVGEAGAYRVEVIAWGGGDRFAGNAGWPDWNAEVAVSANAYREGDSWYRNMRAPGFDGDAAPDPENSLQWLAQRMVADERFAEATVKFWWPAIMGSEVAEPPGESDDADFAGLLLASSAQTAEVQRLAQGFRRGFQGQRPFNLKDLLVEMVLSRWFRVAVLPDGDPVRAAALGNAGAKRLLTPEELARKTAALTGFQWGRTINLDAPPDDERSDSLTHADEYRLLYGGIDSDGIIRRARDITSVMAGVAASHAVESSCPIVLREFYLLPEAERRLFAGVEGTTSPDREFGQTVEVRAQSPGEKETLSVAGWFESGRSTVTLGFLNDFGDDGGDRNVRLDRIDIRDSQGHLVLSRELENLPPASDCDYPVGDHFALHCSGSLDVPVEIPSAGRYDVEVVAWADQYGDELPRLEIAVRSDTERSAGARAIKAKLVELHRQLLGVDVRADSPDIEDAYRLFVDVWERKRQGDDRWFFDSTCDFGLDLQYFDGILEDAVAVQENEWGRYYGMDYDRVWEFLSEDVGPVDPHGVTRTWVVVLAYLLMDYRYLYL